MTAGGGPRSAQRAAAIVLPDAFFRSGGDRSAGCVHSERRPLAVAPLSGRSVLPFEPARAGVSNSPQGA
jgi:hypothetical protein